MDDTEKDLTSSPYQSLSILSTNMTDVREHEKIAREIEKTSDSQETSRSEDQ